MYKLRNLTDSELVILLKSDNQSAFTEIYDRYALDLTEFAGSKIYSLEDARDLLHDLFVKLWEDRHSLDVDIKLRGYLFSAVRYKVIDKIRSKSIRLRHAETEQSKATLSQYSAQDQIEAEELQKAIDISLKSFPPRTREIFLLSRNEAKSISEIAELLDLSEQTVKNQLSTALKLLRKSVRFIILLSSVIYLWVTSSFK